jgi:RHS repeat-associated protein
MKRSLLLFLLLGAGALSAQVFQTADCNSVSGQTPYAMSLDIYDSALFLGTVQSSGGTFSYALPASVRDTLTHVISVRSAGNEITGSPKSLNCGGASPAYQYVQTESFPQGYGAVWTRNGTVNIGSWGFGYSSGTSGSLIYSGAGLSGSPEYEVSSVIKIYPNSYAGTFTHYVRASADALSDGVNGQGSFAAAELTNMTFDSTGNCSARLNFFERTGGVLTSKGFTTVACTPTMLMRTVVYNSAGTSYVRVMLNGTVYGFTTQLTSGQAGLGNRDANAGFLSAAVGPRSTVSPAAIDAKTISTSISDRSVDYRWQDPQDTTGVGVVQHALTRNSQLWNQSFLGTEGTDSNSVLAATTYNYGLQAVSFHGVWGNSTTFSVTTPPAGAIDPRQVGVRPTGSYYGAFGEQIDTRSGNMNYALPLVTAMSRTGRSVPVGLTYNSQNWRYDQQGNTHWKIGEDVGYGVGWKLQIGSVTPYWNGGWWGNVDHYVFSDASGAEYRLQVNTNGVWRSTDASYVWFDSNTNILHFRDGSFWVMGCRSGGQEQDAGSQYPTVIEDSNGNQVIVRYGAGLGTSWPNSSARINEIEDVAAVAGTNGTRHSYGFTYTMDSTGISHLVSIQNFVIPNRGWNVTIQASPLASPFDKTVPFETTSLLTGITQTIPASATSAGATVGYTFSYDPNVNTGSAGELQRVTMPQGGYLSWIYSSPSYMQRYVREVATRAVSADGATEKLYTFHAWGSAGVDTSNTDMSMIDPSGAERIWSFNAISTGSTGTAAWSVGLPSQYKEMISATQTSTIPRWDGYMWGQNSSGNPYIYQISRVLDYNTAAQVSSLETDTVDGYGNTTQKTLTDYDGSTKNTWNWTYITDPNYLGKYIFNRVLTANVARGTGTPITLVTNTYDAACVDAANYVCNPNSLQLFEHDPSYLASMQVRGNVTRSVTPGATVNAVYDSTGTPVQTTDAVGNVTTMPTGSATNFTLPASAMVGPDATTTTLQTTVTYNNFFATTSVTAPNAATTNITYDNFGQVQSATPPGGMAPTTSWNTYTPASGGSGGWTQSSTTNGHWTKTTMDGFGRPVRTDVGTGGASPYTGTGGTIVTSTTTAYGGCPCPAAGKVTAQSRPFGPLETPVSTTYTYDYRGRPSTITMPDGSSTTSYSYSGNKSTVTDPRGNWKTYTTDAFGNLTTVTEPDPDNPGQSVSTNYTYDPVGHLTNVSMTRLAWTASTGNPRTAVTQTRTFTYDPTTFRLMSETQPESGTTNYTYDAATGLLLSRMNGTDQNTKVTFTYAGLGRLASTNVSAQESILYDSASGTIDPNYGQNLIGRVAQKSSASCGNVASGWICYELYSYDAVGNVVGKREVVRDASNSTVADIAFAFTYDSEGHVSAVDYPNIFTNSNGWVNNHFQYTRDVLERPIALTDGNGVQRASAGTYNTAGQMTALTYGAGTETRSYNVLGQLTDIQAGQAMNLHYQYPMPNNGQLAGVTDTLSNTQTQYTYDALRRVTAAVMKPPVSITNGGFEPDASGWTLTSPCACTVSAPAHNGQYSMSINAHNAVNQYGQSVSQHVSVMKGQTYSVSAWASTNTTGTLPVTLLVTDQLGGSAQSVTVSPTSAWQQMTVNFTASSNTTQMIVYVGVNYVTGNPSNVIAYFDDVQVSVSSSIVNMNYAYDGFGNLTSKSDTNGQFTTSMLVEGMTNRVVSAGGVTVNYSAAGNALNPAATSSYADSFSYDKLNRLSISYKNGLVMSGYGYMPGSNEGVLYSNTTNSSAYYVNFYGPDGTLLANYQIWPGYAPKEMARYLYLDGKPLSWNEDRIGSGGNFLPYGDSVTVNGQTPAAPYATYLGDGAGSGLWYAKQRYYNSSWGRFATVDPFGGSAQNDTPQSWNRYAYTMGDPVNSLDPSGLEGCAGEGSAGSGTSTCVYNIGFVAFASVTESLAAASVTGSVAGAPMPMYTSDQLIDILRTFMNGSWITMPTFNLPNHSASGGGSSGAGGPSAPNNRPQTNVTCATVLPNGRTVGSYVNNLANTINSAYRAPGMSPLIANPVGVARQVYSGTNFRKMFGGPNANYYLLGDAGNFAYGAVSAQIQVSLWEVEFAAGAYARIIHQAADRVGPYGMDQSATVNVPAGYSATCKTP